MENTATVLVVDDDETVLDLMRDFLEVEHFVVETAQDAREALHVLERTLVGCILLDVMMPHLSGFDFCRQLRETNDVPILFLSARQSDTDKLRGLSLGGDDYIVKSAMPAEVVARIKAVLRRTQARPTIAPYAQTILDFGRLVINITAHEVRVDGRVISLAAREFALLQLLAEHPRQVFTRDQLFEHCWGEVGDRHTVAVHIARIREKVQPDPAHPGYITTVWGVGYRFEGRVR
ncbi:MAG TPA: response regulator transcription factor [Ktedonobacteraceae bacterium]|jgi:DNA-binding response OmpR family regulator|nr:response regulator transcription factor [Ktedonobacteraceae bacterium]